MALYKYTSTKALAHLGACTLRFSPASDFNDPFDGVPSASSILNHPGLKKLIAVHATFPADQLANDPQLAAGAALGKKRIEDSALGVYRDKLVKDLNEKFRVLCLSKAAPDSDGACLMWGHYAQDPDNNNKPHGGLVLEFDETHPWFAEHSGRSDRLYGPVVYRTTRGTLEADKKDVLFVKSKLWEYEQEVRLVRYVGYGANDLADPNRSIATYPTPMLQKIFVGLYARPGLEAEVAAKLATNPALAHVQVRRLKAIDPDEFKFEIPS